MLLTGVEALAGVFLRPAPRAHSPGAGTGRPGEATLRVPLFPPALDNASAQLNGRRSHEQEDAHHVQQDQG